jgi:hypothetical protein
MAGARQHQDREGQLISPLANCRVEPAAVAAQAAMGMDLPATQYVGQSNWCSAVIDGGAMAVEATQP